VNVLLGVINLGSLWCHHNAVTRGVISGFRCEVGGNCDIVGYYYATCGGNFLQSVNITTTCWVIITQNSAAPGNTFINVSEYK